MNSSQRWILQRAQNEDRIAAPLTKSSSADFARLVDMGYLVPVNGGYHYAATEIGKQVDTTSTQVSCATVL